MTKLLHHPREAERELEEEDDREEEAQEVAKEQQNQKCHNQPTHQQLLTTRRHQYKHLWRTEEDTQQNPCQTDGVTLLT